MPGRRRIADSLLFWLVFSWGASTFFPVGVAYTHMLLVLIFLCLANDFDQRLAHVRGHTLRWPMAAFLGWMLLALAVGPWFPDSGTRLFHGVRVVLLLVMGLLLTAAEARMALRGFLLGALFAALIVAVHHVWELPPWAIWRSLLVSRNNFSSSNMIMMAQATGLLFFLGLRNDPAWMNRWAALGAAAALGVIVGLHALSRNAQILLPTLLLVAVTCHFRSWRAIVAGIGVVVVVASAAWTYSPATQGRFGDIIKEARRMSPCVDHARRRDTCADYTTGVGERWRMGQEALQGMLEHPVFGTGVGSWLPRWREIARETDANLAPEQRERHAEINNPHNDYLLTGMETGIPGLLTMVWLLVAMLRLGWRQRTTLGGMTVILASGVAVTALLNAPLRDAALAMTLLWLLGASIAGHKDVLNR